MNTVRIIGGKWRRRLLHFPDHAGLRPTPDRLRETLFNWLGQDLTGLSCLDLFAGSGALGFEAASRGANEVILVENSSVVVSALKKNAQIFDTDSQLSIIHQDAVEFATALCSTGKCFDVVFLDPPYRKGWLERVMPFLPKLLKEEGFLYVEAETKLEKSQAWNILRQERAGQVFYHLMQKGGPNDIG